MTSPANQHGMTVETLLSRPSSVLALEALAGSLGLARRITSPHIQKTGLALAGFHDYLKPGRVLVFGESEIHFLSGLEEPAVRQALDRMRAAPVPCVLVTGGLEPPPLLVSECERQGIPLLRTPEPTPSAISKIAVVLEDHLAERTVIHGVLLDVLGLGILITGDSGIGKSESALDLVARGHRLVADDTVEVQRRAETRLVGSCPDLTRHHMEIRGLGIINIRQLFGVAATRVSKQIELAVQLERWDECRAYDRLGLDDTFLHILGIPLPLIRMPVAPGRNIAILVEVAARNQLLRARGHHAARLLARRLEHTLQDTDAPDADDISPENERP
ncbi:MAG: HPr(Ser) kinase/phosphatase [Vicinamibacterales bacterium]